MRVLMIGPELAARGGISAVQNLILGGATQQISFTNVASASEHGTVVKVWVFLRAMVFVLSAAWTGRVDLVHIHFASRGSTLRKLILLFLVKASRTPVVLHAHGGEFGLFFASLLPPARFLVRFSLRNADRIIVLSNQWKSFFSNVVGIPEDKIRVMNNPVSLPHQEFHRETRHRVEFLLLGRLGKGKGVYDLIEAVAGLDQASLSRIHVTFAGDGEGDQVRQAITSSNLDAQFTVLPWVGPAERDQLLLHTDVFVLPSYNEGLPMAMLEALSWRCPVIATPVGGIPEVLVDGETGILVNPGDILDIRMALRKMLNDSFRNTCSSKTLDSIRHLNITIYMKNLEDLYSELYSARLMETNGETRR